jgi:hypothetical protein
MAVFSAQGKATMQTRERERPIANCAGESKLVALRGAMQVQQQKVSLPSKGDRDHEWSLDHCEFNTNIKDGGV